MKKIIAAAILAAPVLAIVTPGTSWATQNHTDPCPGQHIPVYNENSNVKLPHFVCGPLKGADGEDGEDGATGPAGPKGETGDTGPAGPSGPAGAPGAPGNDGADGLDGATGPAGPQGALGPIGPQGPAGTNGEDGAVGPQGPAGADGATGPQGPSGSDGAVGPAGPMGPVGPAGADAILNVEVSGDTENCDNGGRTVTLTDGLDEGGAQFEICNGDDGLSKTVIVHADGTQEVVTNLPDTGGNGWTLGLIGAGILSLGAGTMWVLRRQA